MDYYEELGITPAATDEEIRSAYRRLTKLLHPDQQTDEGIKLLAETQMRRLNSIVETLYDPERRRLYDEQLRGGLIPFGPGPMTIRAAPRRSTLHSLPWWVASTVAAVALTVGAVWFWADNWGSSFGNRNPIYIPSEATAGESPKASDPARASTAQNAPTPVPAPAPPTVQLEKHRDAFSPVRQPVLPAHRAVNTAREQTRKSEAAQRPEIAATPDSRTIATVPRAAPRKTLVLANNEIRIRPHPANPVIAPPPNVPAVLGSHIDPAAIPGSTLPLVTTRPPQPATPAPVKANTAALVASAVAAPTRHNPLEGEWVYAPTRPEKRRPGFYPPEFIDLQLFWNDGGLRGVYRAKYQVTGKPIAPNVDFTLLPDGTNKFLWQAANGSRGTLKVSTIDPASIRIEWKTTVYSHGLALTAGTATLVRRAQ